MPDEPLLHDRDGINRRQALWRLLGIALPVNFGLLWAPAGGMQLSPPRNLRISHNRGDRPATVRSPEASTHVRS